MPEKKHLRGVGPKEQRMYEHIKEESEKSGRYGKRAKEVAARMMGYTDAKREAQGGWPQEGALTLAPRYTPPRRSACS